MRCTFSGIGESAGFMLGATRVLEAIVEESFLSAPATAKLPVAPARNTPAEVDRNSLRVVSLNLRLDCMKNPFSIRDLLTR
jgi:hypothetical protein